MSTRSLPPSPNLDQLKRQAKELLRRQPLLGRLRDAQRVLAEQYGFDSWDALRAHVEAVGTASRSIIQPEDLKTNEGRAVWATIAAAEAGKAEALRQILERNPELSRAQYRAVNFERSCGVAASNIFARPKSRKYQRLTRTFTNSCWAKDVATVGFFSIEDSERIACFPRSSNDRRP